MGKYPKTADVLFNTKQFIKNQFFFTIFDRIQFINGVKPDYGQHYFLRMQITRRTIKGKSRKLKGTMDRSQRLRILRHPWQKN